MKKENYTVDVLLDVLECYRLWVLRNGREHPTVVLSDIEASTRAILETCGVNNRIKKHSEGKQ